ncbi:MAG: tripartite tricarboxylate transporter substrate binding protein, partial [Pseudomonadota bacterium]|nr:tripartite tricarboxylate transporter substrate binding protein [Pseudomonadota bacterium]
PPKTVAEFVDYAKQRPGKIRYASAGVGSFPHFDMVLFAKKAGLDMIHIPVKAGASGIVNDMVSGDLQVSFLNVATSAAMIKAGKLRPLAVVTEQRLAEYPDVPTMAEVGYPGIGTVQWQGMFAPAGTPKEVLETLHQAVVQALKSAPVQEAFGKSIIRAVPTSSPDDAKAWLKSEMQAWGKIVAETKIDVEE